MVDLATDRDCQLQTHSVPDSNEIMVVTIAAMASLTTVLPSDRLSGVVAQTLVNL